MTARASACLALGLLLAGCPFALEDDYVIDEDAASAAPVVVDPVGDPDAAAPANPPPPPTDVAPPEEAARPGAIDDCMKMGTCLGDECRGKECDKMPAIKPDG